MVSTDVPRIGTPLSFNSSANLRGVWPPTCTITQQGFSFSITERVSSKVRGSK